MEFFKTEKDENGNYFTDPEEVIRLKCDFVISAFGSELSDKTIIDAIKPFTFTKYGFINVNLDTMQHPEDPSLFCGGDLVGNGTTVEAVNDGKTVSHTDTHYHNHNTTK
jgi:dihydropyrimidine dehydrogenase (NADP+)